MLNFSKKISKPSLSYDPATERDMYPGTIAIIAAEKRPARVSFNSLVKRNVIIVVKLENRGAKNTHMFRISKVILIKLRML